MSRGCTDRIARQPRASHDRHDLDQGMGPEGFRPAIRRCRTFFTAVMPDPDKVATFHTCQTRPGFSLACCLWS